MDTPRRLRRSYLPFVQTESIDLHFNTFTIVSAEELRFDGRDASFRRDGSALLQFSQLTQFWLMASEEWQSCVIAGGPAQFRIGEGPVVDFGSKASLRFRDREGRFEGELLGCESLLDFQAAHYRDGLWNYDVCAADGSRGGSATTLQIGPPALFSDQSAPFATPPWEAPGPLSRPSGLAERGELQLVR